MPKSLVTENMVLKSSHKSRVLPTKMASYTSTNNNGTSHFAQTIDTTLFNGTRPTICSVKKDVFCRRWANVGQLRIAKIDDNCERYQYRTESREPLMVSFDISNLLLYGGEEQRNQTWPIATSRTLVKPFVTNAANYRPVLERVWYTHRGAYVHVEENTPLFVHVIDDELRLSARLRAPYQNFTATRLYYKVCHYENVKVAVQRAIADLLAPLGTARGHAMVEPTTIWTTHAKYERYVDEKLVRQLADLINAHGIPCGQLQIHDWETCRGSLTVDSDRFPDMKSTVDGLHAKGCRVAVNVQPFVDDDCQPFFYGRNKEGGDFVRDADGSTATKSTTGKPAAHIDFTNPTTFDWYQFRLQQFADNTSVDGFKFEGGESSRLPRPPVLFDMGDRYPDTMAEAYVRLAASFGAATTVCVARRTQHYSPFVALPDRDARWNGPLSLATMIPEILHRNVLGYSRSIPGTFGDAANVDKELYVRWLQMTVFMPVSRFSIPPWDFDSETVNITRKYMNLRQEYTPKIYELMKNNTQVNLPLWWIDPTDSTAHTIDTEFLLGEDVLVAPVIKQGAKSRDIYLPKGQWRDENKEGFPKTMGPTWIRDYPADLSVLPYFIKESGDESSASTATSTTITARKISFVTIIVPSTIIGIVIITGLCTSCK